MVWELGTRAVATSPSKWKLPCARPGQEGNWTEGECVNESYNTPWLPRLLACLLPQSYFFLLWRCSLCLEGSPPVLLHSLGRPLHLAWFLSPKPLMMASMSHLPLPRRPWPRATLSRLLLARLGSMLVLRTCSCGSLFPWGSPCWLVTCKSRKWTVVAPQDAAKERLTLL